MSKEAPRYVVTREAGYFDGVQHVPVGTEIEHHGTPGDHLEPVNDAAKKAHAEHVEKAEGTSSPDKNLLAGDLNGGSGNTSDKDLKAENERLKKALREAIAKAGKDQPDTIERNSFEPQGAGMVAPREVDGPRESTGAFAVDDVAEAAAAGDAEAGKELAKREGRSRKN